MASVKVPVYGFASDLESSARNELIENTSDAPRLHVRAVNSKQAAFDAPHQKIVIIDGLLGFKGSMNLTNAGARRADRGLDVLELVTDFREVTELNNKYFSPVWRKLNSPDNSEHLMYETPF